MAEQQGGEDDVGVQHHAPARFHFCRGPFFLDVVTRDFDGAGVA